MAKKAKKKAAKKPAKKAAKKPAKKTAKKPAKKAAKKPAKKAAPKQPAQPPKPKHGEFMWNELMTRDDEKALGFFEQLLGWTHQDWPMGPDAVYRLAKVGDKSAAGIMKMTSPQFPDFVPPHWMSYIAVDNVDARWEKALALGGEAIHPPTDIPEVGRFCILKDPTGAAVALLTPVGGTA